MGSCEKENLIFDVIGIGEFLRCLTSQTKKVYIRHLLDERAQEIPVNVRLTHLVIEEIWFDSFSLHDLIVQSAETLEKLSVGSDGLIRAVVQSLRRLHWPRLQVIENPRGDLIEFKPLKEGASLPRLVKWTQGPKPFGPKMLERGRNHAILPYNEFYFWLMEENRWRLETAQLTWGLFYFRKRFPRDLCVMLARWVFCSSPSKRALCARLEGEICITSSQLSRWQHIRTEEEAIERITLRENIYRAKNAKAQAVIRRNEEQIALKQLANMKRRRLMEAQEVELARLQRDRQAAEQRRDAVGSIITAFK